MTMTPSAAVATPRPASPNPNVKLSLEGSIPVVLLSLATPSLIQFLIQNAVAAIEILFLSRIKNLAQPALDLCLIFWIIAIPSDDRCRRASHEKDNHDV